MRIIGLDVGSKTIGVAVSDDLQLCAHAVRTLTRRGTKADVAQVLQLCQEFKTQAAVVGLPLTYEGQGDELSEGQRARRVRVFGDALAAAGVQVSYHDESYSTVAAQEVLLEADLSRSRRKQVVDKLAAAVILQAYLDERGPRSAEGGR